ncbi:MAG TPA: TonB-dependent receptor [Chryseolinea sp.]|nr:TonB-dependent receptor [Chryseolinea sp.]
MKKHRWNQYVFFLIMKISLAQFIIAITFGSLVCAADSRGQEILDKKVSLDFKNRKIHHILSSIEDQTSIVFNYSSNLKQTENRVSISVDSATLEEVLQKLFTSGVSWEVLDDEVVLHPTEVEEAASEKIHFAVQVSGSVVDEAGLAVPGVNVLEKGTTNGTATDSQGKYNLSVADENSVLVFSFIGYRQEERIVGSQSTINIALTPDVNTLSEVVVIGYGERDKKDLTGSISSLNSKELNNEVRMTPELAMQGKMAGVFVSNPGSDPNARPTIRIRGVSSLGFNDPLYVIDGVPITEGGAGSSVDRVQDLRGPVNIMNMINPNDIESISVLKDASATAIYGVRASNGVILIQTKRGKEGNARINFSANYGIQNIRKQYDVLNTQQYVDLYNEAWNNNTVEGRDANDFGTLYDPSSPEYLGNNPTYNWMDEAVVKNAAIQDYNVSISGGSQKSTYALGAGYANQENALYKSQFSRYSFFINSDHQLTNWLKMGESFRLIYSETDTDSGPGIENASLINPWQPLFDPNQPNGFAYPAGTVGGEVNSRGYGNSTRDNFLAIAPLVYDQRALLRNLGSVYAEISPLKGLRLRGTFSVDYYTNTKETFSLPEAGLYSAQSGTLNSNGSTYGRRQSENINIVKEFLIGYNKSFGNHKFDIVLNAMDQKYNWNNIDQSVSKTGILDFDQRRMDEGILPENKSLFVERNRSGLLGYMARVSYNYKSKYYLDATVRRDGSSKFAPGYKWGTFPALAAAWRISAESFMAGTTGWLDDLKFRLGWGKAGNQETRDFAYLSLVNSNPKYAVGSNPTPTPGTIVNGAVLGDFPIVDMTWETVTTQNIGFDALFFKTKFSFTFEYYHRLTEGILQSIEIPKVIGALNNPVVNLATVENSGIEMQLGFNERIGDLGIHATANLTTVKNRVTKLYRNRPQGNEEEHERIEVAYPINYIYGYQMGGIFQNQEEIDEWRLSNSDPGNETQLSPGDIYFNDLNGPALPEDGEDAYLNRNPDGITNGYDQTYLGKTIPGFFYGIGVNLDYKGFDFGLTFRGLGDVQRINNVRWNGESMVNGGVNALTSVNGRWTTENPSTTMPRAIAGDPSDNARFSNRWVEDADFFRLQNVQLGYNLSSGSTLLQKMHATNLRVFTSLSNVFVVSPYSGLDPEDDSTPTTLMFGINLGF